MAHVGFVVVAHSQELAAGLAHTAHEMVGSGRIAIAAVGGRGGRLGCDPREVAEAVTAVDAGAGVALFADLGSSVLAVRALVAELDRPDVVLADAPLVEGLLAAAVTASTGAGLGSVTAAAEGARDEHKL